MFYIISWKKIEIIKLEETFENKFNSLSNLTVTQ